MGNSQVKIHIYDKNGVLLNFVCAFFHFQLNFCSSFTCVLHLVNL